MAIDYARARRTIAGRDSVLGDLIRRQGRCGLGDSQHTDPFKALVHAIVSQQLSTKAAAAIADRVDVLLDGSPSPARVASVCDEQLRAVGLSGQKVGYLRDLCRRLEDAVRPGSSFAGPTWYHRFTATIGRLNLGGLEIWDFEGQPR